MSEIKNYIILRKFVKNNLFNEMDLNILKNDKVNYNNYDKIIYKILKLLSKRLKYYKLNWDPIATKYRVSSGESDITSNSTDASNFHRDINVCYNNSEPDIYTLVIYLNYAKLEIIPNSYKVFNYNNLEKSKIIGFNPGDGILFNSSNLHRGVFEATMRKKSRKCIQIFEIYKNKKKFDKYKNKILTIPNAKKKIGERLSQIWYHIPPLYKYIKYKGMGVYIKKIKNKKNNYGYISTEAQRPRTTKSIDNGNTYRILLKTNDSRNPTLDYDYYIGNPFICSILYDFILLIFIISIFKYVMKYNKKLYNI
jgi:hypothetical protein